jgi:hypothetical protein
MLSFESRARLPAARKEIVNMKVLLAHVVVSLSLVLASCVASGQAPSPAEGLRCEYLVNPLGIDVERPRLSWALASGSREHGQRAYQILVASSPENLQRDNCDLWISGKVGSSQTTFVVYEGRPLQSGMRAWWKVRVWDEQGRAAWSSPAHWSVGLLHEADWQGRWIGLARPAGVMEGAPLPFPWLRKPRASGSPETRRARPYSNWPRATTSLCRSCGNIYQLSQAHLLHHVGGSCPFSMGCNFENGLVIRFLSTSAELEMGSA